MPQWQWNVGIEHQFPSTMTKEVKRKPIHMHIRAQGKTKVRSQKPEGRYQGPQNIDAKKKYTAPPAWVERMTRGRPSHEIHEFQFKDAIGTSTTKNFVVRRSVRPPGSIFKTSNLIQWTSETTSIQNPNLQKKNKGSFKSPDNFKFKLKGSKKPIFEMGSSSKSVQKSDVFVQAERATENVNNSDAKISTNTVPEKEKDEHEKPKVYMITDVQLPDGDVSRNHENPLKDLDAKKFLVQNLLILNQVFIVYCVSLTHIMCTLSPSLCISNCLQVFG